MSDAMLLGFFVLIVATVGAIVGAGLWELARRVRDDDRD